MLENSQNDLYFQRMRNSLGDKTAIIDYLVDGNVLDVGAGGGELAEAMRSFGHDTYAIDGSQNAVDRMTKNFPFVNVQRSMVSEIDQCFSHGFFNNIVCSSILHEVYSYGDFGNNGYALASVKAAVEMFYNLLDSGGRLIIRDGVRPDNRFGHITFKNDDGIKFLNSYAEIAPFYGDKVKFHVVDDHTVYGDYSSIMEFLYTYTWGFSSIEREALEIYGVMTMKDYIHMLENVGFDIVYSHSYVQDGYVKNLQDKVSLDVPYPDSNMIIIAQKS